MEYLLTSPDGQKFRLSAPDDATPEQIQQVASQHIQAHTDPSTGGGYLQVGPWNTGIQTPQWLDRTLSGAGKAFVDLGTGVEQLGARALDAVAPRQAGLGDLVTGAPVSRVAQLQQQVALSRERDAPLMSTVAGKVGNIVGNAAVTLPTLAIPGANTVAGAGIIGAALGAAQPTTSAGETLTNTAIGGVTGAAGQWLGNRITNAVGQRLVNRQTAAQAEAALNADRDAVLAQSRQAGYVVPPTAVNPSATATALESISGKAATRQGAEAVNARVTNSLIAGDLGLPATQPLTRDAIAQVRRAAGQVYGQVAQTGSIATDAIYANEIAGLTKVGADLEAAAPGIGAQANEKVAELADALFQPQFDAKDAVGLFKLMNERAKANFKVAFGAGGNSQALELARAQRSAADSISDLIDRHLSTSGNDELAQAWREARTTIAKAYTAEAALKGNNVDAIRLAAQLRKGSPLSGGFKTVAEFADHFGEVSRVPKSGVGVSKLAATVGGTGALTALLTGNPGVAAGLLGGSAAPYAIRKGLLSSAGQNLLATPNYAPNLLGTGALNLLGGLGRYGTLPGYMAGNALIQSPQ